MSGVSDIRNMLFSYSEGLPLTFTQLFFWGFFLVVLLGFALTHKRRALRNAWLFFASLFFYYKTSGLFVLILLFSTVSDYSIALMIHSATSLTRKRLWLALSVSVNLSLLCYFKYAHFFIENINNALGTHYIEVNWFALWSNEVFGSAHIVDRILLPVGISFFTFQAISYSVDVYRDHVKPVRSILDFGFFVSFFPQLVAGPIVRAADFIPQLLAPYNLARRDFGLAVFWILNGLVKKVVIGDYIALNFIDRVFDDPVRYSGFECVMALFAYSLQVYADFSGYTDIAIGVALLMGFRLATNFNSPYKAAHVGEFWKRWHMSLSSWLRDYLYIPLGGNRGATFGTWICLAMLVMVAVLLSGAFWLVPLAFSIVAACVVLVRYFPKMKEGITTNINLMMTMLLGGLWHGASWMFVIWGGLNGIALVFYKGWYKVSPWKNSKSILVHAAAVALTLTFITFTRIWFRSRSLETANTILHQVTHAFSFSVIPAVLVGFKSMFALMLLGYVVHWLPTAFKQKYRERFADLPLWAMGSVCGGVIFVTYQFAAAGSVPFIYFQF
jgi:alginate O-acetyltransferase complex protein AlgI